MRCNGMLWNVRGGLMFEMRDGRSGGRDGWMDGWLIGKFLDFVSERESVSHRIISYHIVI